MIGEIKEVKVSDVGPFIRGLDDRGNEVKAALSAVNMPPAVVSLVMDYDASAEGAAKDSKVMAVHRS